MMKHIKALFRVIYETIFDVGRLALTVIMFLLNMAYALVKSILVFLFCSIWGVIRGFSRGRVLLFAGFFINGLYLNGAIFPNLVKYRRFLAAYEPLFSFAGYDIRFFHISLLFSAGILFFNTSYFCYKNEFYGIPTFWGDAFERVRDIFETTFIYRWVSGEEYFWDTGDRVSNYDCYVSEQDAAGDSCAEELNSTKHTEYTEYTNCTINTNTTDEVTGFITAEEQDERDTRKRKFIEYTLVFGDCTSFDEITARYHKLCEECHSRQDHQYLQRVYQTAKEYWGEIPAS